MKFNKKDLLLIASSIAAVAAMFRFNQTKQVLTGEKKFLGLF